MDGATRNAANLKPRKGVKAIEIKKTKKPKYKFTPAPLHGENGLAKIQREFPLIKFNGTEVAKAFNVTICNSS